VAKVFGVISFLLISLAAEPALACWVPWVRTFHDQTVDNTMTVQSGKRCSIIFRSSGPTETHAIIQSPKHGTVQVGSIGRLTYRSQAGFVGSDSFVYVRRGRDTRNNPSVRTVRIAVTVTP
jgi:Big-like domain-containing protein